MLSYSAQSPLAVLYSVFTDPVAGKLLIGETTDGKLCRISFLTKSTIKDTLAHWQKEWPDCHFKQTKQPKIKKLTNRMRFLIVGTPFQYEVWQALLTIPSGQTLSYGELAKQIGRPKAVRAVGTALGKNPLPFMLPCHRVIASTGKIGGFSSPLYIKEKLLNHEGVSI